MTTEVEPEVEPEKIPKKDIERVKTFTYGLFLRKHKFMYYDPDYPDTFYVTSIVPDMIHLRRANTEHYIHRVHIKDPEFLQLFFKIVHPAEGSLVMMHLNEMSKFVNGNCFDQLAYDDTDGTWTCGKPRKGLPDKLTTVIQRITKFDMQAVYTWCSDIDNTFDTYDEELVTFTDASRSDVFYYDWTIIEGKCRVRIPLYDGLSVVSTTAFIKKYKEESTLKIHKKLHDGFGCIRFMFDCALLQVTSYHPKGAWVPTVDKQQ